MKKAPAAPESERGPSGERYLARASRPAEWLPM
jgi:hypothetical protein